MRKGIRTEAWHEERPETPVAAVPTEIRQQHLPVAMTRMPEPVVAPTVGPEDRVATLGIPISPSAASGAQFFLPASTAWYWVVAAELGAVTIALAIRRAAEQQAAASS